VKVAAGQYDLEWPPATMRLLIEMTRNKVGDKACKQREARLKDHEPAAADTDPLLEDVR
jgi:hypothetical protein